MASLCSYEDGWNSLSTVRAYDLSLCAQNVILTPVLVAIFLIFAGSRFTRIYEKPVLPDNRHPFYRIAKLVLPSCIAAVALALLITHTIGASKFTDVSLFASVTLIAQLVAAVLHVVEHDRNRAPSGVLCIYYLASVMAMGWRIRALVDLSDAIPSSVLVLVYTQSAGWLVMMVIEASSTRPYDPTADKIDPNASPYWLANIFTTISFTWAYSMVKLGATKYLTLDDLWTLSPAHTAAYNSDVLLEEFGKAKAKGAAKGKPARHAFFSALSHMFAGRMALIMSGFFIVQGFNVCIPLLVEQLIGYVGAWNGGSKSTGIVIALGFLVCSISSAMIYNLTFFKCLETAMNCRTAVMTAVYRKSLRIPSHDRDSTGSLVNHMQVDASAVADAFFVFPNVSIVPLQVVMYLTLLYVRIGAAAIMSFVLVLIAALVMSVIAKKTLKYQKSRLDAMDERIRLTSEAVKGVRTIKLYGLTPFFQKRIEAIRARELGSLRQVNGMLSGQAAFSTLVPSLLAFVTFSLSSLFTGGETMSPKTVFVVLSILQMLAGPLDALVWSFSPLMSALASYGRLREFFDHLEIDQNAVTLHRADASNDTAIKIEGGYFFWDNQAAAAIVTGAADAKQDETVGHTAPSGPANNSDDAPVDDDGKGDNKPKKARKTVVTSVVPPSDLDQCTLRNINLTIPKGALVAIVATVGQGKSTLLAAMLGEVYKAQGSVTRYGSVAYVPQTPFIINNTVRDNITYGLPYDEKKYQRVIDACSLGRDLTVLDNGDMTMIGEQGVNLSGGQRARIACARAVYSDADIVIFDDPLSAVDATVDAHMFKHMLGPDSMLADKTRILVTHAVHHLPEVDHIILLDGGKVCDEGVYTELAKRAETDDTSVFSRLVSVFNAKRKNRVDADAGGDEEEKGDIHRAVAKSDTDVGGAHASLGGSASTLIAAAAAASPRKNKSGGFSPVTTDDSEDDDKAEVASKVTIEDALPDNGNDDINEHEELMQRGSVSSDVYMAFIKYCGVRGMILNAFLSAACVGLQMSQQYVLGGWSNAMQRDPSPSTSWTWLGIFASLVVLNSVLIAGSFFYFFAVIAIRCSKATSSRLLSRVLRLPMSFFDVTPAGRLMNRFSKDQDSMDSAIPPQVHHFFFCMLQLLSILVAISVATPWFLLMLLPLGLVFFRVQRLFLNTSRELQRIVSVTRSPVFQAFSESLEGLASIRAYGHTGRFQLQLERTIDIANKPMYTQLNVNRWLGIILQNISALVVFGAAIFAALSPEKGTTLIGVSITYAQQMTWMLVMIVRVSADIETNIVSLERIREYAEKTTPEAPDATDYKLPADWPSVGKIELVNYSTRYRPELDLVLKNLSLSIQGGEKIGVVGRTGAGKSSALSAMFRLMEAVDGQILVDGVDIAQLGLLDLRTRLTVLPQEPVIFEGTVRENVDPLCTKSDHELWTALEDAHLGSVIRALPGGLDAPIKSNSLSVGQSQLLCLARALTRKTKILALDEASASIDHATDELVQKTIRECFADCTIITIAHRISTVIDFDRILVLSHGEIAEFDSPEVLLRDPQSMFYGLAKDSGLIG
ncbi:hypothetical protein BC828DRAFT_382676 [Blastocladiella britannica]|nr:hypothetical protein BC828DRAFT_382676 [Blastocladiella britannica]